jgi:hypothetical protein
MDSSTRWGVIMRMQTGSSQAEFFWLAAATHGEQESSAVIPGASVKLARAEQRSEKQISFNLRAEESWRIEHEALDGLRGVGVCGGAGVWRGLWAGHG